MDERFQRMGSSLLNVAYLAVLVVSAGLTYVVGVAILVSLISAAYLLAAGFTIRGKAVEVLVIVGFLTYLFFRGLLSRPKIKPLGLEGKPEKFPRLFSVLEEVAQSMGTRQVDEVVITPGSNISVFDRAGWAGLFGGSHRVLELGIACLHALTLSELKAILAHEYAHFTSRETVFRRFVSHVLTVLQSTLVHLRTGRYWRFSPIYNILAAYEFVFRYFASTFCRQREYLADRLASRCYGGNVLASGLVNFAAASVLFEGSAVSGIFRLLLEGRMMTNVYSAFRAYSRTISPDDIDRMRREILKDRSGLLDSHPCPARRIARIRSLNRTAQSEDPQARDIFEDPIEVERDLSRLLTGRILQGMGVLEALRDTELDEM